MFRTIAAMSAVFVVFGAAMAGAGGEQKKAAVSFKKDVFPIVQKYCLPCHAQEEFNPSELSLDSYELLMEGGKNGPPVTAGPSGKSLLTQKLGEKPPKGDRMPLNDKKLIESGKAVWLTDEEVKVIADWIDQGAKDN